MKKHHTDSTEKIVLNTVNAAIDLSAQSKITNSSNVISEAAFSDILISLSKECVCFSKKSKCGRRRKLSSAEKVYIENECLRIVKEVTRKHSLDNISMQDLNILHQMVYLSSLQKTSTQYPCGVEDLCLHKHQSIDNEN